MMRRTGWALVTAVFLVGFGSAAQAVEPDVVQVQLAAPVEKVKAAVTEVLTNSGYTQVAWKNDSSVTTNYREETEGIQYLYDCCWGVIKNRVEATVTPSGDQTTDLRLQVMAEGKRTVWESFIPVQPPVPESANNQLRLIKNKLKIVSHPYTTQSFFSMK
ncbi:MAG: hypothetical protein NW202_01890 [Nitrospira sp.]|nr:hypothetical protein [Nitrospira sp.]